MLAIRMQRVGRTGHAQFRVIVQDSHFHPTRGRVVAYVGSYDPHTKVAVLDSQKITAYLNKGAQPSDRVIKVLKKEAIKLPDWVKAAAPKESAIRNVEKLRRNRSKDAKPVEAPAGEPAPATEELVTPEVADEPVTETPTEETSKEEVTEPETPTEDAEVPAETPKEPAADEKA